MRLRPASGPEAVLEQCLPGTRLLWIGFLAFCMCSWHKVGNTWLKQRAELPRPLLWPFSRCRGRKRWILSVPVRGEVWLDSGAQAAVQVREGTARWQRRMNVLESLRWLANVKGQCCFHPGGAAPSTLAA